MKLPVNHLVPLSAAFLLASCATFQSDPPPAPVLPTSGPGADYPMVLGEPFTIGDTLYTPDDRLNYDAVGYASVGEGAGGVSGAHKTLPLPSYVEVTHLETGRTVLVRLDTRGPMRNDTLVELSQAAALQLGMGPATRAPVRVRRVNPPEAERAMLRTGGEAPLRMDTPASLLAVLKRKLVAEEPLAAAPKPAKAEPTMTPVDPDQAVVQPVAEPVVEPESSPESKPEPEPEPEAIAEPSAKATAGHYVQVGAFSTEANASKAAAPLNARVSKPGRYWLVRMGPFASTAEAKTALEKARAAGYSDAIVRRED